MNHRINHFHKLWPSPQYTLREADWSKESGSLGSKQEQFLIFLFTFHPAKLAVLMPPDNPPPNNQANFSHAPSEEGLLNLLLDLHLAGSKLQQVLTETLEAIELTPSEFYLLWQLSQRPTWIQSELAGRIGISPPQMSSLVERLRQREFIAVERSSTDRRRQHLRLAGPGQATLLTALEQLRPLSEAVDQQLSAETKTSFSQHCRNLAQLNPRFPTRQRGAA